MCLLGELFKCSNSILVWRVRRKGENWVRKRRWRLKLAKLLIEVWSSPGFWVFSELGIQLSYFANYTWPPQGVPHKKRIKKVRLYYYLEEAWSSIRLRVEIEKNSHIYNTWRCYLKTFSVALILTAVRWFICSKRPNYWKAEIKEWRVRKEQKCFHHWVINIRNSNGMLIIYRTNWLSRVGLTYI